MTRYSRAIPPKKGENGHNLSFSLISILKTAYTNFIHALFYYDFSKNNAQDSN